MGRTTIIPAYTLHHHHESAEELVSSVGQEISGEIDLPAIRAAREAILQLLATGADPWIDDLAKVSPSNYDWTDWALRDLHAERKLTVDLLAYFDHLTEEEDFHFQAGWDAAKE